ncbi:MAG TPA: glycosyltransferase family 2 protein [Candidatus Paceibacterota bacterium]
MQNNQPLISVVIPVYNEEVRAVRAVESICNQTWKNLEIIVVDDGSTDGSYAAVEAITKKDPRVKLYRNPKVPSRTNWRGYDINAGWSARAFGFRIAKGGWITTQDSDDASLLNRIEVEYNLAQKYNATMVTVDWFDGSPDKLNRTLDVDRIFKELGEEAVVIRPEVINKIVKECHGPLMRLPFHRFIPFSLKWFPYTRPLFWGKLHNYPGGDNNVLFRREVIAAGVNLRTRNARTWGVPSGRGTGRDFLMHTAHVFKNNWSFKLPLYNWDVKKANPDYVGYEKYLK